MVTLTDLTLNEIVNILQPLIGCDVEVECVGYGTTTRRLRGQLAYTEEYCGGYYIIHNDINYIGGNGLAPLGMYDWIIYTGSYGLGIGDVIGICDLRYPMIRVPSNKFKFTMS
jgi:hypothetical protein